MEPAMPDEPLLREKARAAILSGKFPSGRQDRMWGGPGVGVTCVICDLPVAKDQMAIEVQFSRDGDHPGLDKFDIHVRCFAAWEFERGKMQPPK
jgi:hypothetical protein